jgi:hypothetical protein
MGKGVTSEVVLAEESKGYHTKVKPTGRVGHAQPLCWPLAARGKQRLAVCRRPVLTTVFCWRLMPTAEASWGVCGPPRQTPHGMDVCTCLDKQVLAKSHTALAAQHCGWHPLSSSYTCSSRRAPSLSRGRAVQCWFGVAACALDKY